MAQDYFSDDYFSTDYFSTLYWGVASANFQGNIAATAQLVEPRIGGGSYWGANYYSQEYWAEEYWGISVGPAYFQGTFSTAGDFTGVILTTLADSPSAFIGQVVHKDIFDVTVTFSVPWQSTILEPVTGTIADSLEAYASSMVGTFRQISSFDGTIASILDDDTSNFDGTFVTPGSFSGTIATVLDDASSNLDGTFTDPSVFLGSISVTLEDEAGAFSGTYDSGTFTGSISVTLEDHNPTIRGNFYGSSTTVGEFIPTLDNVTSLFGGTVEGDSVLASDRAAARQQAKDTIRASSRRGRGRAKIRRGRR